jgi:hypothetical protein
METCAAVALLGLGGEHDDESPLVECGEVVDREAWRLQTHANTLLHALGYFSLRPLAKEPTSKQLSVSRTHGLHACQVDVEACELLAAFLLNPQSRSAKGLLVIGGKEVKGFHAYSEVLAKVHDPQEQKQYTAVVMQHNLQWLFTELPLVRAPMANVPDDSDLPSNCPDLHLH